MDVVLSGRYELTSTLAQGGMGEVWRGLDTMLNRPVAVKLIRLSAAPSAADYDDAVKRFRREAQAVAALNHPNIVTAYDFGIDSETDTPYLVMEMIEGRPLTAELAERASAGLGPLPIGRVLAIATDVCAGLSAAHAAGVIHRDLKPGNLMTVARTGRVKIVDFGIARGGSLSRVTSTGSVVGTVAYIAPEMLMSGEIDGQADLYALGCVLFELLTGRSAYDASDPAQFIAAHLHRAPTPLRELLPDAPEALETLLLDLLAKAPEFRPADADEVATRLAAALPSVEPIVERPSRRVSVPRQRDPSVTFIETNEPPSADPEPVNPRQAESPAPEPEGATLEPSPPEAAAPRVPAQRTTRAAAEPIPMILPDDNEPHRPMGRVLAAAAVAIAVVVGIVVWTTSGSGHHSASSVPPAGATKSSTGSGSPSPAPSPSASTSAFTAPVAMSATTACGRPSQLSFNAAGTQLVGAGRSAGGTTTTACVWTVSTGALAYQAKGYGRVLGAQFEPNNGRLVYATNGAPTPIRVGFVGAPSAGIKDSLSSDIHLQANMEAVAVNATGRTIAVSYTGSGSVQFYNMGTHKWIVDANTAAAGTTGTLTFNPSGSRIAHAEPNAVVVLNTAGLGQSSAPQQVWAGPGATAAAFLSDTEIVTCSGNRVSLFDIASAATTPKLTTTIDGTCAGIAVRAAGQQIAVSTTDHGISVMTLPVTWS